MATLGDLAIRVGADFSAFDAAMGDLNQKLNAAESQASKAWSGFAALGSSLLGAGTALTAAITVPLAGVGAAAVKVAEDLNLAQLAFTTMLGSAEKANIFLKELQAFAAATPFEFSDLIQAAKRMQAMGIAAQDVIPTLRSVGDAAAALGGSKDTIDGITLALGQMTAKGKVSAEEMNQLAERGVPAWKFLADQIGVSIPEAMDLAKKGAISASVAIPAILEGMNQEFGGQMAKTAETLTGVWSNFKDQVTFVLADIGRTLTPILTQLVQAALPLLEWARQAAAAFAALPQPIQTGAIALAAMAAALGPIALALGGVITAVTTVGAALAPVAAAVGVGTAAFAGFAAAIPLVLAALVALGVWVASNWEPISAVVSQAWDGVSEAWMSVWGWAVPYLTGAWDTISKATSTAWNWISGFLVGIWDGIKSAAATIWGGIVGTFQKFLEWAGKIPGVNKLMNLDEAWNSAKKLEEQTKKTTDAVKNHGESHKKAAPQVKAHTTEVTKHTAVAKTAVKQSELLYEMARQLERAHKDQAREIAAARLKLAEIANTIPDVIAPSKELSDTIQGLVSTTQTVAPAFIESMGTAREAMESALEPIRRVDEAYRTLGVTSTRSLEEQASKSQEAYEIIRQSGTASASDLNQAWVRYEEDRIAAAKAAGIEIPAEQKVALDRMKEQLGVSTREQKETWGDWSRQVSTIITDWSKDTGRILFDGDLSWGEKGKKMLSSLGEAVTRMFVEPAQRAIGDLIGGAIADLMGGKGLGGIIDRVKDVGGAIAGVFGGGGATKAATNAGGDLGGAMNTGGAAAGAGLAGVIGAVGSVASAISGVIGNFQMAKMETTLNAIEESTRRGTLYLGDRADGGILQRLFDIADKMQWVPGLLDAVNLKLDNWLSPLSENLGDLNTQFGYAVTRLDQIGNDVMYGSQADRDQVTLLGEIRDGIRDLRGAMSVTGAAGPAATGDLAARLRLQGLY